MAARDLYINLRPSTTQGAFVQSTKNLTAYTFTKFFREEKVSLNIYFLTPTPSAGVGSPASIETGISAYDCRIGIGTPGGTILASTSLTWDTDHFEGVLNINTEQMNDALDASSSGEISSTLEVELGNGTDEATFQQAVTIRDEVLTADGGLPVDNTENVFADSMEAILTDSNSVEWRRTANDIYADVRRSPLGGVFEDSDGIYVRPFIDAPLLFDGLSVSLAGAGAPTYTATPSSASDTATVGGEAGKYYTARVKVVITAEQTGYTGGTQKLGDNTRFYRGGTPPAGNENRVTLSDGTSTYVLNWAASSNAALFTATYYADIIVLSGATLTLTIDSVDGTMVGTSQSCAVTLEQAAEVPSAFTKLAALEALTWVNNTLPIFTGATTVSTVASSSFQAAGLCVLLAGSTMSGQLNFSGTNHAGIKLISLTTTQRDALTPANGMLIYNSTSSKVQKYSGGAWSDVGSSDASIQLYVENPSTPTTPTATGLQAFAIGSGADATGDYTLAIGTDSAAPSLNSVAIGRNASASGSFAVALGYGATARLSGQNTIGSLATSSFDESEPFSLMHVGEATANATQTELLFNNAYRHVLANNSTVSFTVNVTARRTDADNENDAWEFKGLIHRDATAGSTTLDALQENHIGSTSWAVDVDADTTNGALRVRVTGEAAKTIRWVCTIKAHRVSE